MPIWTLCKRLNDSEEASRQIRQRALCNTYTAPACPSSYAILTGVLNWLHFNEAIAANRFSAPNLLAWSWTWKRVADSPKFETLDP